MDSSNLFVQILTFIGYVIAAHALHKYWLQVRKLSQSIRTNGMVIIITDPLSRVGKELAIELAERGGKIYMACGMNKQTIEIQNEIKKRSKSNNIYLMELNLGSFKSIRNFANEFLSEENRLDLLINNADCETFTKSINNADREFTIDCLEKQMGINYFGHFLLTMLLLNCMYRTHTSRILMLTNSNYTHSNLNTTNIDLQMNQMKVGGNNFDWYANSKLANILFTRELSKRLKLTGISINTLNLKLIHSNVEIILNKYFPSILFRLSNLLSKTIYVNTCVQNALHLSLDCNLQYASGLYYDGFESGNLTETAENEELAKLLFKKSEEITGAYFNELNYEANKY